MNILNDLRVNHTTKNSFKPVENTKTRTYRNSYLFRRDIPKFSAKRAQECLGAWPLLGETGRRGDKRSFGIRLVEPSFNHWRQSCHVFVNNRFERCERARNARKRPACTTRSRNARVSRAIRTVTRETHERQPWVEKPGRCSLPLRKQNVTINWRPPPGTSSSSCSFEIRSDQTNLVDWSSISVNTGITDDQAIKFPSDGRSNKWNRKSLWYNGIHELSCLCTLWRIIRVSKNILKFLYFVILTILAVLVLTIESWNYELFASRVSALFYCQN